MNALSLKGNWVDLVIICVLLYFVLDSFQHNFFVIAVEFLSFLASLLLGLRFYIYLANFLSSNFSLPNSVSKAMGFLVTVLVTEGILASIMFFAIKKIPEGLRKTPFLRPFRFIIGFLDGVLLLSFLIPLTLAFPTSPVIKENITASRLGGYISEKTAFFEKRYSDIFGGIISDGLNLLTVNPESNQRISLNVSKTKLSIDYTSETNMFKLVNIERQKAGVKQLTLREEIVPIARNYATDMWERGYFSHYSPEGENVADRLNKAGIKFNVVGENLALAPTLIIAHNGLMNSEGHRENILNTDFSKIAIGVIDNGIYGKIFVQVFTD